MCDVCASVSDSQVGAEYILSERHQNGSAAGPALKEECVCEDFSRPGALLGVVSLGALLVYALASTSLTYQTVANATAGGRSADTGSVQLHGKTALV